MTFSPSDHDWLVECVAYLIRDGYPKVAAMLQVEIDKIDRITDKPPHTFRGQPISRESLKLPQQKKVIA